MSVAVKYDRRFLDAFIFEDTNHKWWVCVLDMSGHRSIGPFTTYAEAHKTYDSYYV